MNQGRWLSRRSSKEGLKNVNGVLLQYYISDSTTRRGWLELMHFGRLVVTRKPTLHTMLARLRTIGTMARIYSSLMDANYCSLWL